MEINVFNETKKELKDIESLLKEIFLNINDKSSFSVIFVSNEKIKELNKAYRNINEITDVLSFPSEEEDYLGDVFISIDKADEQANLYEHSIEREIGFLAVHGYLHLKGYLHDTKEDEDIMNNLTEEILEKSNLKRSK